MIQDVKALLQRKLGRAKRARPSGRVFTLLGVALFGTMIAFVIYHLHREGSTLLTQLTHINPLGIGLSFVFYSCTLALAIVGWVAIASRMTNVYDPKRHIKVYCYTNLARRIPGFLWHVVGRAYLYQRNGVDLVPVSAASALELVLTILSGFMSYALLSLGHWPVQWTWGLVLGIGVGLVVIHPRLLQRVLDQMGYASIMEQIRYHDVAIWLAMYVGMWMVGGLALLSVVYTIQPVDLAQALGVVAARSLSGAISAIVIFLPAGLGVREATLSVLLLPFIPAPLAVTVALMMRVLLTLYEMVWALIAVLI